MTENGKINIDPMVFDEKSYRQALDLLQNPAAKFYITAEDVVRGWKNPEQRSFTYANAADLISRWPNCVNVAIPDTPLTKIERLFNPDLPAPTSSKIPEGAIEVKPGPSVIQGLKWSLDNKKSLSLMDDCMWKDFSCSDPKRLNDLGGLVNCVAHGLENYPNLAREVAENKIPIFKYDQFNPVVADLRDFQHLDLTVQGDKVKYYISQERVDDIAGSQSEFHEKKEDLDPNAVLKELDTFVETAMDGKVPEGAAEVRFDNKYINFKPEYDHLASMMYGSKYHTDHAAFTFASEKDWDRCQAMIENAIDRIKEQSKANEPEQQKSHSNTLSR